VTASALELAGVLTGCGAAALAVVARDPRLRLAAVALALASAPALIAGSVWSEPRVVQFREDEPAVAVAALAVLAAVAAMAVLIRRLPLAFPILAFAFLPLRIPVEIGGETANLLIPLYVVIAASAAVAIWSAWRDDRASAITTGPDLRGTVAWPPSGLVAWLRWLLAATLVGYAAQSAYTKDVSNAIEVAGFFLIPFAVMFSLLLQVEWSPRLVGLVLAGVAAIAALFAGVAAYQYAVRDLFLNDGLLASNQLHQYFRVNSLFYDPNILGRYLALAVTALAAYIAWGLDRRLLAAAALVAALALVGLAFSFSITSFAALLAGLATLALLRWRLPGGAVAAAMAAVAAVVLLLAGGAPSSDLAGDRSLDSGRTDLVAGGLELAADRPLTGWGSGSFGAAFSERIERAPTTVSHSEPVTVAAEQGALGLAVYLSLVVVGLLVLFVGAPGRSAPRSAVAACLVVMLVHSVGYAGFAIDPATWALLALGAALRG
jgi:putative inorganic carbon (hco3(-)) transporter